jgi:hypothetical protein
VINQGKVKALRRQTRKKKSFSFIGFGFQEPSERQKNHSVLLDRAEYT